MQHDGEARDIPRQVGFIQTAAGAHDDDIECGHERRMMWTRGERRGRLNRLASLRD